MTSGSRKTLHASGGSPPVERKVSTRPGAAARVAGCASVEARANQKLRTKNGTTTSNTTDSSSQDLRSSVLGDLSDRLQDVAGLRQDDLLEVGVVRHWAVHGGDALDRGVEVFEQLVADTSHNLGAEPAGQLIFVRNDDAVGGLD